MQIEINGKRNIALDFNAPKKFRLVKDGAEIPYIRTGKNSFRLSKPVDGFVELEEIIEQPRYMQPVQLQPQQMTVINPQDVDRLNEAVRQMALVNPQDVMIINQTAEQLEKNQNFIAQTQKEITDNQVYIDQQQQRLNETALGIQALETDNSQRLDGAENAILNLAGEISNAQNMAVEGMNTALNKIEEQGILLQAEIDTKADKDELESLKKDFEEKSDRISSAMANYSGGTAYDTLPQGGEAGQILAKRTDRQGDYVWIDQTPVIVKSETIPTASEKYKGEVYQYVGETGDYTHGYIYECQQNGTSYEWVRIDVQPNEWGQITGTLSDQTDLQNALNAKYDASNPSGYQANIIETVKVNGTALIPLSKAVDITVPAAQVNSDWNSSSGVSQILNKPSLATVATSGSYNDLSNKPTIPTVNNATLTITQGGTTKGTFTANAGTDVTIALDAGGSSVDIDDKSITTNSSSQIQTVGVINSRDTSTAIKTWTGTKAQYDAIVSKDANTEYLCTDTGEMYLGNTPLANNAVSRNIGEIIQSTIPLSDAGLHLLDGSLISGSGAYSAFVDYIAGLYNDYPTASYFAQPEEIDWVQPVATASTTAIEGGNMVITASNEHSNYNAWKAMDGINSGTNAATGWGTNNTSATQWWQLKLPYQIRITGIKVYHRYDVTPANANVVGRFYTSSDMTTPIGDTLNDTSATNWQESTITGIPSTGIVTDTLYFQKTGGGNYGGLGEVVITATVVGEYYSSEQIWQQSVTDYGVCGKFVYDSVNNTVRLPKITGIIEGTTDLTALGDLVEAGLPDFDAVFVNHARDYAPATDKSLTPVSGAIAVKSDMYPKSSYPDVRGNSTGSYYYDQTVEIRPSISNSIYGNSSTVQPQSVKVLYYIVVANSVKTDIEVDIDEVMTDLNGKADVDLSNVKASGTSLASGWSMPSSRYIDLTLGASGSTYTAPANGWFAISKATSSTNQYGTFMNETNGICVTSQFAISGSYGRIFLPAKEGDVIKVSYSMGGTTQWFRFIYAEGEN